MRYKPSKRKRGPKIGVIGAGAWGTAISMVLADKGNPVEIWCYEKEVAQEIREQSTNSKYLMEVRLPEGIQASSDLGEVASNKDFVFVAVPSLYFVDTVRELSSARSIQSAKSLVGILTKGFVQTPSAVKLCTDAAEELLPSEYQGNLVYISGPSQSEEVARGKITGLISACSNGVNSIRFRELLTSGRLIVFASLDVVGVQISAALKNVIAIAFGMLGAMKEFSGCFGDNTESLLLAAGLNEIQRCGIALGSTHPETFTSIASVGDLDVTCRSEYGRNRRFGKEIILTRILSRYADLDDLIQGLPSVGYIPEGVIAARCVHQLSKQHGLNLPISGGVYRILNRETEPIQELENILKRITRADDLDFLASRE